VLSRLKSQQHDRQQLCDVQVM